MPFTPGNNHATIPQTFTPEQGYSAEIPDGTNTGQAAQNAYMHHCLWRSAPIAGGAYPAYSSSNPNTSSYFILSSPSRHNTGANTRRVAVLWASWGAATAGATSRIVVQQVNTSTGQTIKTVTGYESTSTAVWDSLEEKITGVTVIDIDCPDGNESTVGTVGDHGMTVIRVLNSNLYMSRIFAFYLPDAPLESANYDLKASDVGPARIIRGHETDTANKGASLGTMMNLMGTGETSIESIERSSRRVFWSYGNPGHCEVGGGVARTDVGIYATPGGTAARWYGKCRNLEGSGESKNCYPAICVVLWNAIATNGDIRITLISESDPFDSWYYDFQVSDGANAPMFINQWRTGSSSTNGISVSTTSDSFFRYEISTTQAAPAFDIYSVALFEGPHWTPS